MASYIDVNDSDALKGVLSALNKYGNNPDIENSRYFFIVDRIFDFFPFSSLIDNRNHETLSLLLQLLECFLNNNNFLSNKNNCVTSSLEFVLTNLTFLSSDQFELQRAFLNYLCSLLVSVRYTRKQLNIEINPERICNIVHGISLNNPELKQSCISVLTELFSINDLFYSESDIFELCVNNFFEFRDNTQFTDLCKFATSVLSIKPGTPISRSNLLYYWIENDVPEFLNDLTNELEIYEFLKCLVVAFGTKDYNSTKLTNIYLRKIHIFAEYLKNGTLWKPAFDIVLAILNDLLYVNAIPRFDCNELFVTETHAGQCILNTDLELIINYLKAVYAKCSLDEAEVSQLIARKSFSTTEFSPATLKAVCYIYPMYVRDSEHSQVLNNTIINIVQKYRHLEQIISYEPKQLAWFQSHGNNVLKLRSIYLWLLHNSNNHVFLKVLEDAQTYHFLIKFILNDYEDGIKRRAAEIISNFNSPQISIVLMRNIPKSLAYTQTLGHLLQANPGIPKDDEAGLFYCRMMADVLPGLTDTQAFTGGCFYSHKLLRHFKAKPDIIRAFFSNNTCILTISKAASTSNEKLSEYSLGLMELLMKLQRKYQFKITNPIEVDFTKILMGADARKIRKSLLLMQLCLKSNSSSVIRMSSKFEDILTQYLYLHNIENKELIGRTLETLTIFVKKYIYLGYSQITAIYIRIQCTKIQGFENVAMFLIFVQEVIKALRNRNTRKFPIKDVTKFLFKYKNEHNVDEILTQLQSFRR